MPLWTPIVLGAGLYSWHAADAITGADDGVALATWADSGPNAKDMAQATEANRPTYETNEVNGLPIVRFNGTNQDIAIASVTGLVQPLAIVAALKVNDSAGRFWTASGLRALLAGSGGISVTVNAGSDQTFTLPSFNDTNFHVMIVVYNGANSYLTFDGTAAAAADVGSTSPTGSLTLASTGAASSYLVSDWGEVAIMQGATALTSANIDRMNGYLAHKWGLTTNLPSDHPYKNVAPLVGVSTGLRYAVGSGLRQRRLLGS